jgi:tRNA(His) guanylyltransferase
MQDALGDRVKSQYESRTRYMLPRRTYTIIRLDYKAFHTYTRKLNKPFDLDLIEDINAAVIQTLKQIQGAQFAYVQSDECSILLTDFAKPTSDSWFDGNIQKIASVSASILTAEFNLIRKCRWDSENNMGQRKGDFILAYCDSRVFTVPDPTEVYNTFIWRNQDCSRNSISMVASSLFSHSELEGKNSAEKQEMIFQKAGINWAEYDESLKNGRLIVKENYFDKPGTIGTLRTHWVVKPAPVFTRQPEVLKQLIPKYE